MVINSNAEEAFAESKRSPAIKILGAILALALTGGVFAGYTYLRNKHAREAAATLALQSAATEPKGPPQALITIDDAMMRAGKTLLGGTVKNTTTQKLGPLSIELELKRRKDGGLDKKLVSLQPSELEPQQEAQYSLEIQTQEYGSARVSALRASRHLTAIAVRHRSGSKKATRANRVQNDYGRQAAAWQARRVLKLA